ncbi:MAG: endonuclease/exonuclease/phosphatase family protein [Sphingobacteriales bacterium]|mgnify:CR=1 FL=1|nr:endonuclease/exonuclease/phosphatase family protein [Sphingobacteriales bacterium]OJW00127.1 MAG: hypothetical protein BGO52_03305 [Sphingobacteriales bacterium 44-61]
MRVLLSLLFSIALCCAFNTPVLAQRNLTILSYNVLKGFDNDSLKKQQFTRWVTQWNTDIIAFEEMNKFTQPSLEIFARGYGHGYATLLKENGFPVAISSKYPITHIRKVTDNMHHGYIYARVLDYHLYVLHLSPFSMEKKIEEINTILADIEIIPKNEKIILLGDFNARSPQDSSFYDSGKIAELVRLEQSDPRRHNLINGRPSFDIIRVVEKAGFSDTYHLLHKETESSIPTKSHMGEDGVNKLARIDYIFLNPRLASKCVKAVILKDNVTDTLSDHYPMLVHLKD